ncbi:MAG: DUF2846 domain-containing protein [Bacteroidetes bacterium]|nr:DUF2846 domain-containing protein [Bacteroidota bacterium]MCW5896767.1 DUF2846 domain-containing protein [Bacteroidota bacterium]
MRQIDTFHLGLLFAITLSSVGCSSSRGPLFKEVAGIPHGRSIAYLYRPDDGKSTEFDLKVNGAEIGILERMGYFPVVIEEGKVEITSAVRFKLFVTGIQAIGGPAKFVFKAEAGKTYYVECLADQSDGQRLSISVVPGKYGRIRIRECTLILGDVNHE